MRARRPERDGRAVDGDGMASLFARCVPGSIDALEAAARGMMHAQLALGLLGTSAGFHGSGYLAGVVAMSALGLVAIETSTKALLKVRERDGADGGGEGRGRGARGRGFASECRVKRIRVRILRFCDFVIARVAWGVRMRRLTCARGRSRFVVHGGDVLVHDMARRRLVGSVPEGRD